MNGSLAADDREQILAKVKSGVDVKTETARNLVVGLTIAALAGVGIGLLRSKKASASSPTMPTGGLNHASLTGQGFTTSEVNRILAVQPWVDQYSAANGLNPSLVNGVIWVESRYFPASTSSAGARGLMQLMPGTQAWWEDLAGLAPGDPFDARHNIQVGTYGLARLLRQYSWDERKALGAYNWGSGNVDKSPNNFPLEVDNYVTAVQKAAARFRRARGG